jgi:hypothetical protein
MRVDIRIIGPVKSGKTQLLKLLKTAAVGYALGRNQEIEVTTTETSSHKSNGLRPEGT